MTCLKDGELRARVDGEPGGEEAGRQDEHLRECPGCEKRLKDIRATAHTVWTEMAELAPKDTSAGFDAAAAYARFRQESGARERSEEVKPGRWFAAAWPVRSFGSALAAGLALVVLFSFAPARTWAQHILEMLRVQKLAVVPVDMTALAGEAGDGRTAGKLLTQMISDTVVVTEKPGEPQTVTDANAAAQFAGFAVRTLPGLGAPQRVQVSGEGAFHTTLDRVRMEDLLAQVGRSDIQIPPSADGSTIAVHLAKRVSLAYGDCATGVRANAAASGMCVTFLQTRSPVVSVPPSLNLAALAEAGLEVAGMSTADAHAFAQTVDWTSTLVIPIPQQGSSFRKVPVDGAEGTLVETAARGKVPRQYALLWVKDGMVNLISGSGDAGQALAAADAIN